MGLRSCSNQTKFGIEYPQGRKTLRQKEFGYSLPLKKIKFSYRNLRLFQISNFKNRSF